MNPLLALYKKGKLNRLKNIVELLRELDVDVLCDDYNSLMKDAPQRHRANKKYFVKHSGMPSGNKESNRIEEHLAMALANATRCNDQSFELPDGRSLRFIDYQVPLKEKRNDEGVGKVDLVGILEDETLVIIELKVLGSSGRPGNSALQAFVEGLAYCAIVQKNLHAFKEDLKTEFNISGIQDKILLCVLAPDDYWRAIRCYPGMKELKTFASRIGKKLDLEIQFLSLHDHSLEMGAAGKKPTLSGKCILKPA